MNEWYEIKCKYTKEYTDGTLKRVTDAFLVNAMSFTEAESVIYKQVAEYIRGEFLVNAMTKKNYMDIFMYDDSDVWYEAKVAYISEDADSGREKKVTNTYLVSAADLKEAYERIEENLKGLMVTHETPTISKTKLVEVFPYDPDLILDHPKGNEEIDSPNINVAYAAKEE